jgi:glucosamine-6-phosphate deaminase
MVFKINIYDTKEELGKAAAKKASKILIREIANKGHARFMVATGASQFEFLKYLTATDGIDWKKTEMFQLDEYIGLSVSHPASFRKYLKQRFIDLVNPGIVHMIQGDAADIEEECKRYNHLISKDEIDVAFIGIGENGHIAFNDPPADFETEIPYIVVELDQPCREQQLGEGWFDTLEQVPKKAITASVRQILKAKEILCICPDERKAIAVKNCLSQETNVDPMYPASILKTHPNLYCFLDNHSAKYL